MVAPGIAETLLATAMGLIAAIPAVVMNNSFARTITGYRAMLGDAACRVAFSDGKVDKRLVEYEWDEFRQVSVADRSRGVASMSTNGRSSARTVFFGQRPAHEHR